MVGEERRVILAARQVVKDYPQGDGVQRVLDHLSLEVEAGRFVGDHGSVGIGQVDLLHLLGGLDTPDSGEIELDGTPLSSLNDDARTRLRRNRIGIVYQFFNLVPVLTVAENIALPAVIAGRPAVTYRTTLEDVIELVGPRRPSRQAAVAALGRPAAARGHRPGAVHLARRAPRRRAHRQPRPHVGLRGARALPGRAASDGPDDRHGHARPAHGRSCRARCTSCATAPSRRPSTSPIAAPAPRPWTPPTRTGPGWCSAGWRTATPPARHPVTDRRTSTGYDEI